MIATQIQLDELRELGAANLYHGNNDSGALDPGIKPIDPAMKLAGPALTVNVPAGDNLALHIAISRAAPGSVLVVDYKGHMEVAVTGDIMALAALQRGLAGMVIDGAVRDADEIARLGLPVFARGLSIRGPAKMGPGSVGNPVTLGHVVVHTGDIVVGDRDGVVVLPAEGWSEALDLARQRDAREEEVRRKLMAGETTVSLMGLSDDLIDINMP
ncbi:MAG: 4-hydroxy-4-methyl-2-oxoglutarate aldolase [Rhizobiales bacterium]|nr:4-hydroxy-4-methyl-2-oxoglutarate aldolase [Hyphomicrobiales bacterium]